MLRLSKFLLLAGVFPAAWAQQSYPFFSPSPSPPLLVTATANSPFGQSSYCYWVVVVYPIGKSTPSAPSCISNAIETSSVLISWSAASGASSYDVLRTTTPILPNVTSSIAVATAVSGTTQTDSFGALSSYTIASAVPATANLYLDNTAFSTPQLRAIVTGVGGTTAFNLGSGGGGTPGGANGQVQFNNAGAFGGFTVSGDATLNTGTGVLTVGNGAITNAKLANSATTVNGQTCTLGSTCNANAGAAAHSVSLNEGAGAALAGATIGTSGRLLIDQGAAADPSFNALSGDATITNAGVLTVTQVNGAAVPASAKLTSTNAGRQIVAAAAETAPITVSATGGISCPTCVTSAASLTNTDCVSGSGGQAIQTPSANCTIDGSGNVIANGLGNGISSFNQSNPQTIICPASSNTCTTTTSAALTSPDDNRSTYSGAAIVSNATVASANVELTASPSTSVDDSTSEYSAIRGTAYSTASSVLARLSGGSFYSVRSVNGIGARPLFGSRSVASLGLSGGTVTSGDGAVGAQGVAYCPACTPAGDVVSGPEVQGLIGLMGLTYSSTSYALPVVGAAGVLGTFYQNNSTQGTLEARGGMFETIGTMAKVNNAYGIQVKDVSGAQNLNMSLYTGAGTVQFGGDVVFGANYVGNLTVTQVPSVTSVTLGTGCPTDPRNACTNNGTKNYSYQIVAVLSGSVTAAASTVVSSATGFDNLATANNANRLTWSPVEGAVGGYRIYRTVAGGAVTNTTGLIATVAQNTDRNPYPSGIPLYTDTGAPGDSTTPPSTNTTGVTSSVLFATSTNCSSSASPAVCGSAAAGSAAVPAGTTTVTVNTTAVTANSIIQVTEDQGLGSKLSVTCNTQSLLVVGPPRVTARVAGTSFTVGVDAGPTTNPLCFGYSIIN